MKKLILTLAFILSFGLIQAQAQVNAPTSASYFHTDVDFNQTVSVKLEFFQCGSISGGTCVNQAAQPFQTGVDIPKASITTLSTPDAFGNTRTFSLTSAPASTSLQSLPAGVPFIATLIASGDPATGAGSSARSAASNPFFPSLKALAPVTNPRVK